MAPGRLSRRGRKHSVSQLGATDLNKVTFAARSGWTIKNATNLTRVGAVEFAYVIVSPSSAVNDDTNFTPLTVSGARRAIAVCDRACGHMGGGGVLYAHSLTSLGAGAELAIMLVILI